MSQFADNIANITSRIAAAAERAGRRANDVRMVGVTKYVDAEVTRQLVLSGCRVLGESRPQVLWEKAAALTDLDVEWHLIGHLQRNKVKRTLPLTHLIHSVDSLRLLTAIHGTARELDMAAHVLLEVNVSSESAKHGFQPSELEMALEAVAALPALHVDGLMCMAGLAGSPDDARREFASLRELLTRHESFQTDNIRLKELSMGMSGDFEVAVEEGATLVRIGSLLFE